VSRIPAALLSALDGIGADATEESIRFLLPDPDAAPSAPSAIHNNAVNYAICYVPRSGSTHLTSLLQNTGLAGNPADFFNAGYRELPVEREQVFERTGAHSIASAAEQYGCRSVADYLNIVSGFTRTANGVFGLKMDLSHATILIRRNLFWSPNWNWKYIYLTRRDLLMQAISYYIASTTGLWSSLSVGQSEADCDERAIEEKMRYLGHVMSGWECVFGVLGIDPLRITYEEIESAPEDTLVRCLRHIGVECEPRQLPLESSYRRQRTSRADAWAKVIRARARGPVSSDVGSRFFPQ
jgi:LPS sulfotransferase NodH